MHLYRMAQFLKLKRCMLALLVIGSVCVCGLLLTTSGYVINPRIGEAIRGSNLQKYTIRGRKEWLFTGTEKTNTVNSMQSEAAATLSHEEIRERFQSRRRLLQKGCELHGRSNKFRKSAASLLHLHTLNAYYCPIPKCSSTTWRRLFKAIRHHMGLNRTGRKTPSDWNGMNAVNANVIVFVREPYMRLLSAYVDKLFGPNPLYWDRVGTYIVAKFRPNASDKSLRCGHDVTFSEFIKYVIHSQTTGEHRDSHFIPTHDQCRLCEIPYLYVGHLETIAEDLPFIERAINSPVTYTRDFDNLTLVNNTNMVFNRMRPIIQECMDLEEAGRRIWKKWHARGIISKSESFPLSSMQMKDIDVKTFQIVSLKALDRSGDTQSRRIQKSEALAEAFNTVSLEDRLRLQELLFLDFKLFGFDPSPREVFPLKSDSLNIRYSYLSPWD